MPYIEPISLKASVLLIGRLEDEEALAEIGHLHHDGIASEIEHAEAIDQVLAGQVM